MRMAAAGAILEPLQVWLHDTGAQEFMNWLPYVMLGDAGYFR